MLSSSLIYFSVVLNESMCISAFRPSLCPSNSFVILFIYLALWLPYFSPKSFGFSCVWLLECFPVISSQLWLEFSLVVLWDVQFCLYCFALCQPFVFNLPSFVSALCFFPQVVLLFFCIASSFFPLHVSASFLCFIILACFRRIYYLHFLSNFPFCF